MQTITITEALVELKTLDKRIKKHFSDNIFITTHQSNKAPKGFSSLDSFSKIAKVNFTSIQDLIKRRNIIKSAIVKSNALTTITIEDKVYSVAEAIERKTSIKYEQDFLHILTSQLQAVNNYAEKQNSLTQSKLDTNIETMLGKEGKTDTVAVEAFTKQFWTLNEIKILDPCNLLDTIESMRNNIDSFMSQVDTKLTISNSVTVISI